MKSVKIGIIQESPIYLDVEKSMQKAIRLIEDAVEQGAKLIVFGETWLSGYPVWLDHCPNMALWDQASTKEVFTQMHLNSIEVPGKETEIFGALAKQYGVVIVIGVNEIVRKKGHALGTIYNALLTFDEQGNLANHHRKLMPTFTEKLVHGLGDGAGLKAVETSFGRVGGLICWEHWMPLTRQTMHNEGETIHIAVWPNVHELLQIASRSYAFEGRCFVIAVGQITRVKDLPKILDLPEYLKDKPDEMLLWGGSCVIGPDGHYILEPQCHKEGIFIVEVDDLDKVYGERMALDVTGHYNRLDVFNLEVNRERKV